MPTEPTDPPQVIDAAILSTLLAAADVPTDVVRTRIDLGGYPSSPGVWILTDHMAWFARALVAVSEAIGDGAASEASRLTVASRGGTWGAARELCAHLPGWVLDGPLTEPVDDTDEPDDLEPLEVA